MTTRFWSRLTPWLGVLGAGVLTAGLFLDPASRLPETAEPVEVTYSRRQVQDAVDAVLTENPALKDNLAQLKEEMREGAKAQALFVAEGFTQGLAMDDYIVRNRLVEIQMMALYEKADALVTEEAVARYFETHRERYRKEARRFYLHLFVPVTNLVGGTEARQRLEELWRDPSRWSEPRWVSEEDLRLSFGPALAKQVFELPRGEWSQAIRSGHGWHYLKVLDEEPARLYELEEVKSRVKEDYRRELREQMYQAELRRLKQKYRVKETE